MRRNNDGNMLLFVIVVLLFIWILTAGNGCTMKETVVFTLDRVEFENCTPYFVGWVLWTDYPNEYVQFDEEVFVKPYEHGYRQMPPGIYGFTVWDPKKNTIREYWDQEINEGMTIRIGCE